jgi:hypothetical protein
MNEHDRSMALIDGRPPLPISDSGSALSLGLEASNKLDKVHALLGLATDIERLGLYPDYSKDVESAYQDTVIAILEKVGDAGILSCCQFGSSKLSLPSWVPDWSATILTPLSSIFSDEHAYSASGDRKFLLRITKASDGKPILKMAGMTVDQVKLTHRPWRLMPPGAFAFGTAEEWLSELEDSFTRNGTMNLHDCWRVPIADLRWSSTTLNC